MEIWVINKPISVKIKNDLDDIECLWRKQERNVILFDFLYVNTESDCVK